MRECKIYIKSTVAADGHTKANIAASGAAYDIVTALADALICMIGQTKKDGKTVDRLAYEAIGIALGQRDHTKTTGIIQTARHDKEATP